MRAALVAARRRVVAAIEAEAQASADGRETGGILIGRDDGELIVLGTAGGPGPNADRRVDGFLRDLNHAQQLAAEAYIRDRSVWVGEWHTHPTGGPVPSSRDAETYTAMLKDDELHFDRVVSLIVTANSDGTWESPQLWPWIVTPGLVISRARLIVTDASFSTGLEGPING